MPNLVLDPWKAPMPIQIPAKWLIAFAMSFAAVGLSALSFSPVQKADVSLASQLLIVRGAIDRYHKDHRAFPGQTGDGDLEDHLCKTTNRQGIVGKGADFHYGPYLHSDELPDHPLVQKNSVKVVAQMPGRPDGRQAWMYCITTGDFRANTKRTANGTRHFDM